MKLKQKEIKKFQTHIRDYYKTFGRTFAWRETVDPYHIVVSEIMLQQTQTHRVTGKFEAFVKNFPTFKTLADAPLREVLAFWQGLGYNRRAMALQKTAQKVVNEFGGILPNDPEILVTFPGIGKATASSICAFAFNKPTVFIETNIRTVFIHFFFQGKIEVHDKEIIPLIEQTVDQESSRVWYYALMDYGVMLKKNLPNPSRRSKHHAVQSKFEGSDRQIRGKILKILTQQNCAVYEDLLEFANFKEERINKIINELIQEGFIQEKNKTFWIR